MDLIRKLRVLVGALARTPFMPRPEKVDLEQDKEHPGPAAAQPSEPAARRPGAEPELQQPQVTDTERVADLIARQQRQEAD
jgi:hypothetical protein